MFRQVCVLGWALAWTSIATAQETPDYVIAVDEAAVATSNPADMPSEWLLAFVDIETTGLRSCKRMGNYPQFVYRWFRGEGRRR
jgi:hypothetical protein